MNAVRCACRGIRSIVGSGCSARLVDDHGFPAGYASVRRFVSTVRQQPAVEAPGGDHHGLGEEIDGAIDGRPPITPTSLAGITVRGRREVARLANEIAREGVFAPGFAAVGSRK